MIYENNSIYVDIEQLKHNLISPKNNIRLYLGIINDDNEFTRTVDTIKDLPDTEQLKIRNYLRSIFNI